MPAFPRLTATRATIDEEGRYTGELEFYAYADGKREADPLAQARRDEALTEVVLHRLAHAEIAHQRQGRHELSQCDCWCPLHHHGDTVRGRRGRHIGAITLLGGSSHA